MMSVKTQTLTPIAETGNKCFQYTAETQHRDTKPLQRPRFHILSACVFFNFAGVHARQRKHTHLLVQECEVLWGRRQNKPGPSAREVRNRRYQLGFCAQINIPTKTHRSWSYCHCCGQVSGWCPESSSQAWHGRRFLAAPGAHHHRCTHRCPDLHEQESKMSELSVHQQKRTVITANSTVIKCSCLK